MTKATDRRLWWSRRNYDNSVSPHIDAAQCLAYWCREEWLASLEVRAYFDMMGARSEEVGQDTAQREYGHLIDNARRRHMGALSCRLSAQFGTHPCTKGMKT